MNSKKKLRWLWQALALSIGVNVIFLLLFYSAIFRKDIYKLKLFSGPLIAKSHRVAKIPEDFLTTLSQTSFHELYCLLDNNDLFHGRPIKLWALSALIHNYYVDITPVLSHPLTFTELKSKEGSWLLPNLGEKEYFTVRKYLSVERYPLTSEGLFVTIARDLALGKVDEDCLYTFCHTPEFLYLRTVLAGAETRLASVAALAHMVIEGGSELFFSLCDANNRATAISDQQRRGILIAYMERGMVLASLLLLANDQEWVLHEFPDVTLLNFIQMLPKDVLHSQEFISRVLASPRAYLLQSD
ncbi:hypothetical protein CP10139811_0905 [Chlamydia ibidis]|uniref:Uncharacterized protein n=2 Tax=Chlamydia ibidis TaxID=1405396 RepID=S7KLP4_9CHLA|nr:hypothetical protein [Chlamydia ibidis]EPP35360.1 hypothetical protein CP10139811_0905 [Chlamydia ibidis]EQM62830.1 putative membrane protein [Chlamydia ibidis 10-1398/6]